MPDQVADYRSSRAGSFEHSPARVTSASLAASDDHEIVVLDESYRVVLRSPTARVIQDRSHGSRATHYVKWVLISSVASLVRSPVSMVVTRRPGKWVSYHSRLVSQWLW